MLIVPVIEWLCDKLLEIKSIDPVELVIDASILAAATVVLVLLVGNT